MELTKIILEIIRGFGHAPIESYPKIMLFLEFLKILSQTYFLFFFLILFFVVIFRKEIGRLIDRTGSIKFPGGSELSTSQQEKAKEDSIQNNSTDIKSINHNVEMPQGINLNPDQVKELREFILSERANAFLWEYRFLNYYLVPMTQRVLDWLISNVGSTSIHLYNSVWLPLIPDQKERVAILGALSNHSLIQIDGEKITVNEKGKEYAEWRGKLPEIKNSQVNKCAKVE